LPDINPFWTVAGGSAQLVAYASHQGSRAIQMFTSGYGQTAALRHEFGTASFGTVEVFVYTPGVAGTGYKQLWAMGGSNVLNSCDIYLDWGFWKRISTARPSTQSRATCHGGTRFCYRNSRPPAGAGGRSTRLRPE
jgi:hypothetical protein